MLVSLLTFQMNPSAFQIGHVPIERLLGRSVISIDNIARVPKLFMHSISLILAKGSYYDIAGVLVSWRTVHGKSRRCQLWLRDLFQGWIVESMFLANLQSVNRACRQTGRQLYQFCWRCWHHYPMQGVSTEACYHSNFVELLGAFDITDILLLHRQTCRRLLS